MNDIERKRQLIDAIARAIFYSAPDMKAAREQAQAIIEAAALPTAPPDKTPPEPEDAPEIVRTLRNMAASTWADKYEWEGVLFRAADLIDSKILTVGHASQPSLSIKVCPLCRGPAERINFAEWHSLSGSRS